MEETGNFNRMASQLSLDERNKLLEKLSSQAAFSNSELYEESPQEETIEMEIKYQKLPWFYKIWFSIVSFFNSRPPVKMYEDYAIREVYRSIEQKAAAFYNYQKDMLLPSLQEELIKLRESARFFYDALDTGLNRDKGGLMVFLGSLELPVIHKRIVEETDPEKMINQYKDIGEVELRQKAVKYMEESLAGMTEDEHIHMYDSARSLNCLKQLSSFLFDRLINSFIPDSEVQGNVCPARSVRDQLINLNNILFSLNKTPPITLLESLFVFALMDRSKEEGFDMATETHRLLIRAETALLVIRQFNKEVPLTKILRCILRDINLTPKNIGGGEDWFALYKERWRAQLEEHYFIYIKTKRQRDLQNSFRHFFKGASLKMLESMEEDENFSGFPIKGLYALSFLQTFYTVVFMGEVNKYIRPVLIDGDFINKENKAEFTECYNNIIKLEDLIVQFDRNISADGDYGKRFDQAKNDISSLPVKRRKIQIVVEEASMEAAKIIRQTKEALKGLIRTLDGILKRGVDTKYDTLNNLAALNVRGTAFTDGVSAAAIQIKKTLDLLTDVEAIEDGY
jgi:hypothetical protein